MAIASHRPEHASCLSATILVPSRFESIKDTPCHIVDLLAPLGSFHDDRKAALHLGCCHCNRICRARVEILDETLFREVGGQGRSR